MSAYDNTGEQLLQIDHKRRQKEQNYRRAEAFLLWKLGTAGYDEARRFLRGSGMDWPSLFVEFCEKVEEEILARMRDYDKVYFDNLGAKAKLGAFMPTTFFSDFLKSPPMMDSPEPRKPMRRHWKDAPYEYSPEELEKLKAEDDGERQ